MTDTTDPQQVARDRLLALIASIPGSGGVDWCDDARALLNEIAATPAAAPSAPADRSALRDRIAEAVERLHGTGGVYALDAGEAGRIADAVLAVLPAPDSRTAEIERLRKEHATWRKLGQRNLERAHEENARLRAVVERIRVAVRRLAAHAVGFGDVLDESDRGPWGKTVAADIAELRRVAGEAQQTAPWLSDSARIGRTLIWTWADIGKGVYGQGYRAAQTEARALLTGQRDSVEAQQPETQAGCGCPNENAVEHQFGTADCTCIPFVREGGTARYCQPGDTVDQISGWERGGDCPHHRPTAVGAQQPKEAAESRAVCVCGHTRGEHVIVGGPFGRGRLLCTVCNGLEGNACKEFEAL